MAKQTFNQFKAKLEESGWEPRSSGNGLVRHYEAPMEGDYVIKVDSDTLSAPIIMHDEVTGDVFVPNDCQELLPTDTFRKCNANDVLDWKLLRVSQEEV